MESQPQNPEFRNNFTKTFNHVHMNSMGEDIRLLSNSNHNFCCLQTLKNVQHIIAYTNLDHPARIPPLCSNTSDRNRKHISTQRANDIKDAISSCNATP